MSTKRIALQLNAENVPPPGRKRGRTGNWVDLDHHQRLMQQVHAHLEQWLVMGWRKAQAKIQRFRADLFVKAKAKTTVRILPSLIESYLPDARTVLGARHRASPVLWLLGDIVLRADECGHVAELRGNLRAAVNVDLDGAGRGI